MVGTLSVTNKRKRSDFESPAFDSFNSDGIELHVRIGNSVVEQLVLSHSATDVLRELVQNAYDAGATRLVVEFGEESLRISNDGTPFDAGGWKRLSVLLGTGGVIGSGSPEEIGAKQGGIGLDCTLFSEPR